MKSFKDYVQDERENTATTPKIEKVQDQQTTATAEELTKKIASAYHGTSNADMLKNILTEAEKSKRNGTLSNEEIEAFYQTFSPMLDAQKRKRLRAIIDELKQI